MHIYIYIHIYMYIYIYFYMYVCIYISTHVAPLFFEGPPRPQLARSALDRLEGLRSRNADAARRKERHGAWLDLFGVPFRWFLVVFGGFGGFVGIYKGSVRNWGFLWWCIMSSLLVEK